MIHVSAQEEMTSNGIGDRSRHILFRTTREGCGSPKRGPSKYTKRKHELYKRRDSREIRGGGMEYDMECRKPGVFQADTKRALTQRKV